VNKGRFFAVCCGLAWVLCVYAGVVCSLWFGVL
jgi:hypothetical protein